MTGHYDYLIVGGGLFGATFAYCAKQRGKTCLVIEKRQHLGGNIYCEPFTLPAWEGQGGTVNVHKYGPHIFHTNNKDVWDFVNSFVRFNSFKNCPLANYKGEIYHLPFNMNTFTRMWPEVHTPADAMAKLEEQGASLNPSRSGNIEPKNLEEQAISLVGVDIYRKIIKEYTEKQWGRDCKELPTSIIKRLPVRMTYDNNYYDDRYQGIPIGGYNKLIEGLMNGIETKVNFDFFKDSLDSGNSCPLKDDWRKIADKLVYTGPLDEYFGYKLGKLDWRSVSFKTRIEDTPNFQGNAVINYTSHDVPYTRIIEHKHFEMFGREVYDCPQTVVTEEYPTEYRDGMVPCYPINDDRNNTLAEEYRKLAMKEKNVTFGGRLGQYRYYDMDDVVAQVYLFFCS